MKFKAILVSIIVLLLTIPVTVESDSGSFIVWHGDVYFTGIPVQTAVIVYRNGLEYLLVLTTFAFENINDTVDLIYYFPLPSKPLASSIAPVEKSVALMSVVQYDTINLGLVMKGMRLYFGRGGEYSELGSFLSKYYNISLIETREASIDIFREILLEKGYEGEIPKELNETIKYYLDKGWRYFAIGIVRAKNALTLVQQYVFKTDEIIYPLVIDKINKGEVELTIFIITDKSLESIIDPFAETEKNPAKFLEGVNTRIEIYFTNSSDYKRVWRMIDDLGDDLMDELDIRVSNGGKSMRILLDIPGILYVYEKRMAELSNIKNDLIGVPSSSSDLTLQVYRSMIKALPLLSYIYLVIVVPALLIYYVIIYLLNKSGKGNYVTRNLIPYASFVLFVVAFNLGVVDYNIAPYMGLYMQLLLSTLMGLVLTIPFYRIVLVNGARNPGYTLSHNYGYLISLLTGLTIWNHLILVTYVLIPMLTYKYLSKTKRVTKNKLLSATLLFYLLTMFFLYCLALIIIYL